jgi:hypothetical protein
VANVILKTVPYAALWIATTGFAVIPTNFRAAPQAQTARAAQNTRKLKSVIYTNKTYGFRFTLPQSWKAYSIRISEWEGGDGVAAQSDRNASPLQKGPLISIGDPRSTEKDPRQNIPIMVFTRAQWQLIEENRLIVSSAPIPPSELRRNKKYVFALPPRYNYALIDGSEEVNKIIQNHPLQAF